MHHIVKSWGWKTPNTSCSYYGLLLGKASFWYSDFNYEGYLVWGRGWCLHLFLPHCEHVIEGVVANALPAKCV